MYYASLWSGLLWAGVGLAEVHNVILSTCIVDADATSTELSLPLPGAVDRSKATVKLVVGAAEDECSYQNSFLNGQPLVQQGHSQLQTPFAVVLDNGDVETFDFTASLSCVEDGDKQRTEAIIHILHHNTWDPILDFTFSYTQSGRWPVIEGLRYEVRDPELVLETDLDTTYKPATGAPEVSEVHDDSSHSSPDDIVHNDATATLQDELLTLDLLQAHAAEIEKEIKATQHRIMAIWKADFAHCSGLKCYLKTALSKAPTFVHLLVTHFSHHHHLDLNFFKNSTHTNCTDEVERVVQQHQQQAALVDASAEAIAEDTDKTADEIMGDVEDVSETQTNTLQAEGHPEETVEENAEPSGDNEDKKPWWWHKRPEWRQHGPPWARPDGNGNPRPFWGRPNGRPGWRSHENPTPGALPPSDFGTVSIHHRPSSFALSNVSFATRFQVAFIILAASIISLCAFSLALYLCVCHFRDPRRQADRAARREERLTRALYRKAACKYRWTTFWQRFTRLFTISYWFAASTEKTASGRRSASRPNHSSEEKSSLIVTTHEAHQAGESSNSNIVTSQINNLRAAHSMVRQLMRAEEGRAPTTRPSPSPRPVSYAAARSTDTLPAYSLPPPSYHSRRSRRRSGGASDTDPDGDATSLLESESEGDSDMISVVHGFTDYTLSTTNTGSSDRVQRGIGSTSSSRSHSQNWSRAMSSVVDAAETESSVVTCSPRLSLESERRF